MLDNGRPFTACSARCKVPNLTVIVSNAAGGESDGEISQYIDLTSGERNR